MSITHPTLVADSCWTPACGGTEKPFIVKGRTLLYMWNRLTGEHAYYDVSADLFLSDADAFALLSGQKAA